MKRRESGSVMLESVMVLPILLLLIFFLIQLSFLLLAKQMTYYAAYCGARAALVYNPQDYSGNGGVVHRAACTVLAWISQSTTGSEPLTIPSDSGEYRIPRSENIENQVSVEIQEGLQTDNTPIVTVTVNFQCPLLIPIGGRTIAWLSGAGDSVDQYGWHTVPIREFCSLAKPYRTETFPLVPAEDRDFLGIK